MNGPPKGSWLLLAMVLVAGGAYYQAAPGLYTATPSSKVDRSFAAVVDLNLK